jgi:hypothetical protein
VAPNEIGLRNEFWRRQFALGTLPPPRFARLFITRGVELHPRGMEALAELLGGPEQSHPDIDPHHERDMRKVVLDGTTFFMKWDYYSIEGDLDCGSEDPSDDLVTTRVATVLLAEEY